VVTLKILIPYQDHGYEKQVFAYKKINVECLSKEFIERMYEELNANLKVIVFETADFYTVQYPGKPFVILKKLDGRLYTFENDYSEESDKQAGFFLRILHKFNLVEEMHSARVARKIEKRDRS
jgi:hypothetical protein